MEADAPRMCALLIGLPDVTVVGVGLPPKSWRVVDSCWILAKRLTRKTSASSTSRYRIPAAPSALRSITTLRLPRFKISHMKVNPLVPGGMPDVVNARIGSP